MWVIQPTTNLLLLSLIWRSKADISTGVQAVPILSPRALSPNPLALGGYHGAPSLSLSGQGLPRLRIRVTELGNGPIFDRSLGSCRADANGSTGDAVRPAAT
jgi:hypothetical protein